MKLLLHTCCAPCLIYPLQRLKEKKFCPSAFFYNPNIHPFGEYLSRKEALDGVARGAGVELVCPDYAPEEFFRAVNQREADRERCFICWSLRLKRTARAAREKGFGYFSTTLLVSPYQDQDALRRIGGDIGEEEGVDFYYEDFRPGFRYAHEQAKAQGIYCQRYCGCIYSEIERCRRSQRR